MKKSISMILALVICLCMFAGCGGKTESTPNNAAPVVEQETVGQTNTGANSTADSIATPPPKDAEYYDELSMYIGDKVALVDPLNAGAQTSQTGIINHLIFDTLVYYTLDNNYEPCLATEWSTDDAIHYNFKLRDDVYFHNGEHFTADDVLFTVESSHEVVGASIYVSYNQVESVEVVNDYEVNMTLVAPNYDFIYDVAAPGAPIVNREAYESGDEHAGWIGTGPFKLENVVPNDSLSFVINDDYWGEKALCKKFSMRYIAEETARNIMLENDEFTFVNITSVFIPQYENDDRFVINSYVMNNCNYIAFNMRKPITGDKNFRMAVACAIDRQAAVDIALGGYGKACDTGTFWGNNSMYKNTSIPLIEQDLDKAKEYLAQSCYNGEEIELCAGMAQTIKAAQVYQEQLKAIGINAVVHEFDGPSMTAATIYETNQCDIVIGSGAWSPLASSCKSFLTPGNNSNKACYDNPEVVALIEEAAATPDGPDREALYFKVQELVAEDMPYLGTFHMAMYIASQKGAGGALYFATNYHDYGQAYRLKLN